MKNIPGLPSLFAEGLSRGIQGRRPPLGQSTPDSGVDWDGFCAAKSDARYPRGQKLSPWTEAHRDKQAFFLPQIVKQPRPSKSEHLRAGITVMPTIFLSVRKAASPSCHHPQNHFHSLSFFPSFRDVSSVDNKKALTSLWEQLSVMFTCNYAHNEKRLPTRQVLLHYLCLIKPKAFAAVFFVSFSDFTQTLQHSAVGLIAQFLCYRLQRFAIHSHGQYFLIGFR